VIAESLRLYPEPPILIRRALEKVELPQVRALERRFAFSCFEHRAAPPWASRTQPVAKLQCTRWWAHTQGGTDKKITLLPGADVFIAVWNLHRSPDLWENPTKFDISRWTRPFTNPALGGWAGYNPELQQGLYPTETATDFAYIPFGGGIRKCVGDQFAIMESTVVLSMLLQVGSSHHNEESRLSSRSISSLVFTNTASARAGLR
jgi:cytochrome P450